MIKIGVLAMPCCFARHCARVKEIPPGDQGRIAGNRPALLEMSCDWQQLFAVSLLPCCNLLQFC
jgi:hypothetical protein